MSDCESINTLTETQIIAGSEQYFEFKIYNSETGLPIDISDLSLTFTMNSITDSSDFNSISIDAEYKDTSTFRVILTAEVTQNSRGVYLQQPILIDYDGKKIKPAQGRIIVTPSN